MVGKVAAFAHFGAKLHNVQWSWSAVTDEGEVVLALWKHRFDSAVTPHFYSEFGNKVEDWTRKPGNRERIANLVHARDTRRGQFRVVMAVAKDIDSEPKKIDIAYQADEMIMRLVELNESTGEFSAERIVSPRGSWLGRFLSGLRRRSV